MILLGLLLYLILLTQICVYFSAVWYEIDRRLTGTAYSTACVLILHGISARKKSIAMLLVKSDLYSVLIQTCLQFSKILMFFRISLKLFKTSLKFLQFLPNIAKILQDSCRLVLDYSSLVWNLVPFSQTCSLFCKTFLKNSSRTFGLSELTNDTQNIFYSLHLFKTHLDFCVRFFKTHLNGFKTQRDSLKFVQTF